MKFKIPNTPVLYSECKKKYEDLMKIAFMKQVEELRKKLKDEFVDDLDQYNKINYYIDEFIKQNKKLSNKIITSKVPTKKEKEYSYNEDDEKYFIQTIECCIDGKNLLRSEEGLLFNPAEDYTIVGKICDTYIEWY